MKRHFLYFFIFGIICASNVTGAQDERPIVSPETSVRVQYQLKSANAKSWTTASVSLKGAVSESMMVNQLSARHPNRLIRILSADTGCPITALVKYQSSRDGGKTFSTGCMTVRNALTESMARNQLEARMQGCIVRILSMERK